MEGVDLFMGLIAPYINFFIFIFIAIKLFKKPIQGMIAARKKSHEDLVAEATRAKKEAEAKQKELNQRLSTLDSEIEEMRNKAREAAELAAKEMLDKARSVAANMTAESKRLADAQLKQAKEKLQAEIVQEVTSQVEAKLRGDVDSSKHQSLVSSKIYQLKAMNQEV